ncbi:helix-turn-helix domain-containing protein [Pantoea sp. B9002]|uniref:helix-turn-helix domain-containing protein n=1 Tax=Pantoea sp. B9002 TaxID=2726979 RepID=UPI0015A1985C|nr:helix-turn-helix domain-containing protein [Pantoea sp. B9002]
MDRLNIIHDLQEWIEHHLGEKLGIEEVANKSGYSKFHLQRLFRELSGYTIGSYIRFRRLTKAAIELKLTNLSVGDIAERYNYSSQSAFTRTFFSHYRSTPADYRRSEEWDCRGMLSPARTIKKKFNIISLPEKVFKGRTVICDFKVGSAELTRLNHLECFRMKLGRNRKMRPPVIYGVHHYNLHQAHNDISKILYTTAVEERKLLNPKAPQNLIYSSEGYFAQYSFAGTPASFTKFAESVYQNDFPGSGLIRRKGNDIERYYTSESFWDNPASTVVQCDYFIPVRQSDLPSAPGPGILKDQHDLHSV